MDVSGKMKINIFHRQHLSITASGCSSPLTPKLGPKEGSRKAMIAFLLILFKAIPRPTQVVVLPSPAAVGSNGRNQYQFSIRSFIRSHVGWDILALYFPYSQDPFFAKCH